MTRRRRRLAVLALLGLGVLSFGSGYVAITSNPPASLGDDPTRIETSSIDVATGSGNATLSATNMAPGDTVAAAITISNSSREPMTYGMRLGLVSVGGAALAAALMLTIRTAGTSCADFDGEILFDGPLDKATIASVGSGRRLAAATAEILCFRASLGAGTGNALQNATTTVVLTFTGERAGVR
jgi:hypothetical protein